MLCLTGRKLVLIFLMCCSEQSPEQRCSKPTRLNICRLLIIFVDLFESAVHVSGDKLVHLQEHF